MKKTKRAKNAEGVRSSEMGRPLAEDSGGTKTVFEGIDKTIKLPGGSMRIIVGEITFETRRIGKRKRPTGAGSPDGAERRHVEP